LTANTTKATGKLTRWTAKEFYHGLMAENMKVSLRKIKEMAKESSLSAMVESTLEAGNRASSTVWV
jgi:hypothetical protein